nr:LysR family substrate-binding domain-containing protein [Streptomyces sp. HUAS 15-9]
MGLRIGSAAGSVEYVDRVLASFAERVPDVPVELVALPAEERLGQVAGGQLDAAFVRTAQPPPGVRVLPVWADPLMAALPAAHPLAARAEIDLAELAGLPLALTPRRTDPALVDLVVDACRRAGFEPLRGPVSGSRRDTLAAVGARPLWMVVYASHARERHSSRVAFVPFRAPGLALSTGLAVPVADPTPHLDALVLACADR